MSLLLPAVLLAAQASTPGSEIAVELARLRGQVLALDVALQSRQAQLDEMKRELGALHALASRAPAEPEPLATPFLSAPPNGSDSAGVAKVAVFSPRLRVDSQRSHEPIDVRLRRVESRTAPVIGELQLSRDGGPLELPIDRNGALYVVEWSIGGGHNLSLHLEDGATGQTVATVQVRPDTTSGRFLFVAYRTE